MGNFTEQNWGISVSAIMQGVSRRARGLRPPQGLNQRRVLDHLLRPGGQDATEFAHLLRGRRRPRIIGPQPGLELAKDANIHERPPCPQLTANAAGAKHVMSGTPRKVNPAIEGSQAPELAEGMTTGVCKVEGSGIGCGASDAVGDGEPDELDAASLGWLPAAAVVQTGPLADPASH